MTNNFLIFNTKNRVIIISALLLLFVFHGFAVSADMKSLISDTTLEKASLENFGKGLAKEHDFPSTGDNLAKSKFAFERYCEMLIEKGYENNANWKGRWQFALDQGTRSFLACTEHCENLRDILNGMGVKSSQIISDNGVRYDVNNPHVGLLIMNEDGEPYVFDTWMHGLENREEYDKTFRGILDNSAQYIAIIRFGAGRIVLNKIRPSPYKGAKGSKFNGQSVKDWIATLQKKGSKKFCWDTISENSCSTNPDEIISIIKKANVKKNTQSEIEIVIREIEGDDEIKTRTQIIVLNPGETGQEMLFFMGPGMEFYKEFSGEITNYKPEKYGDGSKPEVSLSLKPGEYQISMLRITDPKKRGFSDLSGSVILKDQISKSLKEFGFFKLTATFNVTGKINDSLPFKKGISQYSP